MQLKDSGLNLDRSDFNTNYRKNDRIRWMNQIQTIILHKLSKLKIQQKIDQQAKELENLKAILAL